MKLSPEAIRDFQKAYEKDFGKEISPQGAEELGNELLLLMNIIYRPIRAEKK